MTEPVDRPEAGEVGEVERAWSEEIERRVSELRIGSVELIASEDVFAELDALVR